MLIMLDFDHHRGAVPLGNQPVLASDMRRYFSFVGVPSFAPAVAMAKAEAAERALRLLSSSRQDDTTMPLLKENKENSARGSKNKNTNTYKRRLYLKVENLD